MKKIKITENELISLIEKIVNENLGSTPSLTAHGGGFNNLGIAKPTDKYKDLYEDDDIESVEEDQDPEAKKSFAGDITIQPGSDDEDAWMESIVDRLKGKLTEGKCPKSGCITKRGSKWRIISNKTGKLWDAEYDSKADAEAGLDAYHANN